jgi:hypothetical protein
MRGNAQQSYRARARAEPAIMGFTDQQCGIATPQSGIAIATGPNRDIRNW